jgi:hypothetical protein
VVAAPATGQDGDVEPEEVWMVPLGAGVAPDDVRGTLRLGAGAVAFTAHAGTEMLLPYAAIRRVRRIRGSPVLVIDWDDAGDRRRTALYFSQPPPLDAPPPSLSSLRRGPLGALGRSGSSKRQVARTNVSYLRTMALSRRDVVRAWERAVAERVREAG